MIEKKAWKNKIVSPEEILSKIEPGMSIFLGTGVAEPRTLIRHLITSDKGNLRDLEFIQLVSLGDAIPVDERYFGKYRLKTFFSGWVASEAIDTGRIDFIPSRFSRIPWLFKSGVIGVDAAFIQITPPNSEGFSSLGIAVDAAREAMKHASLVVGVINDKVPFTLGDTLIRTDDLDYLVYSTEPPICFPRWPADDAFDRLAANVASMIKDGSCISFFMGPLFDALAKHLVHKKDLGIHSFLMTDATMDLIKSGAVTNRLKRSFKGKTVVSYAQGTPELLRWLDRNPIVEFQGIDVSADPEEMGNNDNFAAIVPARKVDLRGRIAFHTGRGNIAAGPGEAQELFEGAIRSRGGRTILALPSRNLEGRSNILISIDGFPNQFNNSESLDIIVTEHGVASMRGRTLRERALALIDIAHPECRKELVRQAKEANILYADQIYITETGHFYPEEVSYVHDFKDGLTVHFRPIKPSDEENMRRLFYGSSDKAVYFRYFSPIKEMPHKRMQEYTNVDYTHTMSIVGVVEESGTERIVAEGRYVRTKDGPTADLAIIVDENLHGIGIGTFLLKTLIKTAKGRGIEGFTANVLTDNKPVMRIFEKSSVSTRTVFKNGLYELTISFYDTAEPTGTTKESR